MSSGVHASHKVKRSLADEVLVRSCLLGDEEAWSALIDKYKSLIFSIPIRYGLSADDASDIFQSVCITLLRDLASVREPRALVAWLIKATARQCALFKRNRQAFVNTVIDENTVPDTGSLPETFVQDLEREQILRETIAEMQPECVRLIEFLFFSNPPLPYDRVAHALGFAKGSVGATRMRCLEKLRLALEKKGFC
ncbi:MAG: sigma-70 family RNA polymerase sigma factor [Verrucomicrobia bacterium]|nr:sigma-70 family RNA polymerase sigma factor [Verrucomicrobiota bacterium]